MSLIGQLLHAGIQLAPKKQLLPRPAHRQQIRVLQQLMRRAARTAFGKRYDFDDLLRMNDPRKEFRKWIPVYDYEKMYKEWWHRSRQDEPDVTWPGIIPYYGVSSGSTQASSKFIPVTRESLYAWNVIARRVLLTLSAYPSISPSLLGKQSLMIGGSSGLTREGLHYYGDNSGIMAKNRPYWLKSLYQPGEEILEIPDWEFRVKAIVREAPRWDIAFLVGNPAWIQLILEEIIAHYKLDHIHQLWPNLSLMVHSGIFFEPFKVAFEKTLGRPLLYLDFYAATEAMIGYQTAADETSMKLIVNKGAYYEFIPFDESTFDEEGNLKTEFPDAIPLEETEEDKPYALLISTASGAWHYQIGDVIRFTNVKEYTFRLQGRTKQNLNLTGEHLTEGNMNDAIQWLNLNGPFLIREFCVCSERSGGHFNHRWYIGSDQPVDVRLLKEKIDQRLRLVNDDYATQRAASLIDLKLEVLPVHHFYDWLSHRGKQNGQAKIPRILSGILKDSWQEFLSHRPIVSGKI